MPKTKPKPVAIPGESVALKSVPGTRHTRTRAVRPKRRARSILPGNDPTADAAWFVVHMTKKYPELSKPDKHRVLTVIKAALPPKPSVGRPRREDVTQAMRLEADGVARQEIDRLLDKTTHHQKHALR
jgi:hypothetical protein